MTPQTLLFWLKKENTRTFCFRHIYLSDYTIYFVSRTMMNLNSFHSKSLQRQVFKDGVAEERRGMIVIVTNLRLGIWSFYCTIPFIKVYHPFSLLCIHQERVKIGKYFRLRYHYSYSIWYICPTRPFLLIYHLLRPAIY